MGRAGPAEPAVVTAPPAPFATWGPGGMAHSPQPVRRDPRAELAAQSSQGLRGTRIDRAQTAPPPAAPRHAPPPQILRVDSPAFLIAAVADGANGALTPHDRQILGAARQLAQPDGAVLLLAATAVEHPGLAGADRTLLLPPAPDPGARAAQIAQVLENPAIRHALFPDSPAGGDLARRVAALRREALFTDVERVSTREVTRPAHAGRTEYRAAPPRLLAIAPDCAAPYAGPAREARAMTMDFPAPPRAFIATEDLPQNRAAMPLAEADFVVAAGTGVTDFPGFLALASALGATPGASRVVCDAGLLPRDRQVGASGTVLSGSCYLALGIAGAPQHLQGVAAVEHVIAVNTDLHAAMIKRATLAIVADAQAVIAALLQRLDHLNGPVPAAPPQSATGGLGGMAHSPQPFSPQPFSPHRAIVLLSAGHHPISAHPCPVPVELQAIALARGLGAASITGLHAGGASQAVQDCFGHGLQQLEILQQPDGDPLAALAAAITNAAPDLVLAGRRGRGGADSGLLPYRLAESLGWPICADAVGVAPHALGLAVTQALPRGARRRVVLSTPAIVTVHPAAPAAHPFTFAAARRGQARLSPSSFPAASYPEVSEYPYRRRPRLPRAAAFGGTAEDRLRAATEISGGGVVMRDASPDAAAAAICEVLERLGLLGAETKTLRF